MLPPDQFAFFSAVIDTGVVNIAREPAADGEIPATAPRGSHPGRSPRRRSLAQLRADALVRITTEHGRREDYSADGDAAASGSSDGSGDGEASAAAAADGSRHDSATHSGAGSEGGSTGTGRGGGRALRAEVIIHVRGDGGTLDDGTPITMTAVERIAPEAALRVMIHDAERHPINVSGLHRHPTARQRRLVKERDRVCVACGSSEFLEYHDEPPYEQSGRTLVEETELRCSRCHRRKHGRAA